MSLKRLGFEGAALGLVAIAGCAAREPGFSLEAGDGDGDNGIPLTLELARFNPTGQFLLLRFSEPMAPVEGVNPADFRISLAITSTSSDSGYESSSNSYYDPNSWVGFSALTVKSVAPGQKPEDIVLRFDAPVDPGLCQAFAEIEENIAYWESYGYQGDIGLFPHYAPGDIPIKSADGEVLAPIGPMWVKEPLSGMYLLGAFGWPNLDPQVPIPCNLCSDLI